MEETLNERLKKLLEDRGISQRELSRRSGLTESAISHYVAGDRSPNSATLIKLANALGTTPDYLLFGDPFTENDQLNAAIEMVKRCAAYLTVEQKVAIMESMITDDDKN